MQEFELIERIAGLMGSAAKAPEGALGIGDDCAVIPFGDKDLLVSTDILIENSHFRLSTASPEDIGWKAGAVNISDIAAMGGDPKAIFLSLGLPREIDQDWLDSFFTGLRDVCNEYDVKLLGGDMSSAREVTINITVIGEAEHGRAVLRSGAKPGDVIAVTGTLGDSGLGLQILESGEALDSIEDATLTARHCRPMPQVALGKELAERGVHAMMDISDGVAGDLKHILKASSSQHGAGTAGTSTGIDGAQGTAGAKFLAAEIDLEAIPLSPEYRSIKGDDPELALSAGEDFQLLFTASPEMPLPEGCTVIGRVTEGETSNPSITYIYKGEPQQLNLNGFRHF